MQRVETASTTTLSGNAARPFSVSGVTTAPSEIPTMTEMMRDNGAGMSTGRPHNAAVATPSNEPVTRPAGNPAQVRRNPPPAATASVSAARSHSFFAGIGEDAIGAINAAPSQRRQTPARSLVTGPLPQGDADEVGAVPGAELFHDPRAMNLDGAEADAQRTARLLVGGAGNQFRKHLALTLVSRSPPLISASAFSSGNSR